MKKIIPIMIAAAMLFAGCIIFLDNDSDAIDDGFWVNGHEVTGDTTTYSESEHWTYTASSKTLTLNGVTFTNCHSDGAEYASPIYDGRNDGTALKIVLNGENVISGHVAGPECDGIYSDGDIEISGTGSLTINPDPAGDHYSNGIYVSGNLTIRGGTITVSQATMFDLWPAANYMRGAKFRMEGGTVNLNGGGDLDANGDIIMSGGTINTTGVISATSSTFTFTGGLVKNESMAVDDILVRADNGFIITGGTGVLTNLSPQDSGTPCDLADADMLVCITAGTASVGSAPVTYTVSFDKNGGTGTMADVTGVSGSYTLPACAFTAPSGKQFKCWSVADVEKNVGDSITVTANTTVKAVWQAAGTGYTVTFDANGGTGTMAQVTGVSGEYTLPESTFTAPDGKEFKCWKVGDDEKNAGDKITVSSDVTVKAVWKDKSSGGGSNIGLIIGGVVAGVLVVGAVVFFLIKRQ